MKLILATVLAAFAAAPAFAQNMQGMSGTNGMSGMNSMAGSSMTMADGAGVVKAVDPKAGTVTIQHGPIAALEWPAMTMTFKATRPALLRGVSVGQSVTFQLMRMGGAVQLTAIAPK
ncbi:MAG: copper-binding protein [Caulobacteraceae bacterium]